jgi:hypothetical protein
MEHEDKFLKSKQEIKHAITECYKKVDNGNDHEARNFNEMFPLEPEKQKSYQIKNSGMLQASTRAHD